MSRIRPEDCPHTNVDWDPPMDMIASAAKKAPWRVWAMIFGGDAETDQLSIDVKCLDCEARLKHYYKREEI